MLPTKFGIRWPFRSGEVKNRFLRWRPSWITDRNDFSYFWSTSHPDALEQVLSQLAFGFRRRSEKLDFQDGGHLGFPVGTILATFYLQVIPMLPTKLSFESIGLSVQEKKWKIDFQDGGHVGFRIGTILAIFDVQVTPMLPTKFRVNWPFCSGEEAKKRFSRWPRAILDFLSARF